MINLFVYGTLMSGERANDLLQDTKCVGVFRLADYAMYNLGSFPGIVKRNGESVIGEVYEISEDRIPELDSYEGEGSLYKRTEVTVSREDEKVNAICYVYNHFVHGEIMRQKWNAKDSDLVWYACYGSNLSAERFNCYIKGGVNPYTGRSNPGCRKNRNTWSDSCMKTYPGRVYFGNHSLSWGGHGVAFYDVNAKKHFSFMRLYKITREQFLEVREQEGPSDKWYGRIVCLDVLKDGCPVYTITSEELNPEEEPSEVYANLIRDSLLEQLGKDRELEIDNYMAELSDGLRIKVLEKLNSLN